MSDNNSTQLNDETSGTCELHHVQMVKATVPIEYGLIHLSDYGLALHAASQATFPHAQDSVSGGCCIESRSQAVIYHCRECRKAKRTWMVNHPRATGP
jgi:hypothetical protein